MAGLLLAGLFGTSSAWGQVGPADSLSLVERYRAARLRMLVRDYLASRRAFPVQPPEPVPTGTDSLFGPVASADTADTAARPRFPVDDVRRVRDLERSWFKHRFRDVEWSFLGAGTRLSFFDTTRTRDLRARMQAQFGDPTRTLAEMYSNEWINTPDSLREEPIQFAYWFVVNDSIPVRVSDVGGPRERGVIVSTDRRYRHRLPALRAALLRPLRRSERAPYVDYYYEEEVRRWYRVGFDGASFFRERISRFDILSGRRPRLDSVRTPASAAEPSSTPVPDTP